MVWASISFGLLVPHLGVVKKHEKIGSRDAEVWMAQMDSSRRGGMDGIDLAPSITCAVPKSLISIQKPRTSPESTTTTGFSIGN